MQWDAEGWGRICRPTGAELFCWLRAGSRELSKRLCPGVCVCVRVHVRVCVCRCQFWGERGG